MLSLSSLASLLCIFALISCINASWTEVQGREVIQRQDSEASSVTPDVHVNGLSTASPDVHVNGLSTASPDVHVNGLSTVPADTTPDIIVNGLSTVTPTPTNPSFAVVVFTNVMTVSGSVVTEEETATLFFPLVATALASPSPQAGKSNLAAIAGGVVGGVIFVAIIAGCLFIRSRRRSKQHWRNRTAGRWNNIEGESGLKAGNQPGSVYVGNPEYTPSRDVKVPITPSSFSPPHTSGATPVTPSFSDIDPLFIRDKHRLGAVDHVTNEQTPSPRRYHQRGNSNFINHQENSDDYIEMETNPGLRGAKTG